MLKKLYRLTRRGSFTYVQTRGSKYHERCMMLALVKGRCKRIGFVVSNKLGKAVRRNLIKRRMRAACAELLSEIEGGQLIFIARKGIEQLNYSQIKEQIHSLLLKSGQIK